MAVSFSISDITSSSIRVNITGTNTSTYRYIRIFAKETLSGQTVHDNKWIDSRGSNLSDNITGLSANTSYTINVSYNSTNSANGATWVGGQTARTSGGGGSETYIYRFNINVYLPNNNLYKTVTGNSVQGNSSGAIIGLNTLKNLAGGEIVGGYYYNRYSATSYCLNYNNNGIKLYDAQNTAIVSIGYGSPFEAKITYYPNGGTGTGTTKTHTSSSSPFYCTLESASSLGFYRADHTFSGWATEYNGSVSYSGGQSVRMPINGNYYLVLYAYWKKNITYNISFYANGGSGTMDSLNNCQYDVSYILPANKFEKNHSVTLDYNYDNKKIIKNAKCPFLHWSYNNKTYADQATVKNLANSGTAVLYAQWGEYSVTLPTLTRSGYIFLGWFTSAIGGSQVNSPATGISDKTLYAHWKENVISPIISSISHTDTTITISLNRNNATTGSWIIEASLSNFGTVVYTTTITSTTQTTITLTGLTPETTYYIRARHVNGGVSASSNIISATTRTSTFQWTSNDSVYVIKSAVFTDAITAAKWNELIKKVNWCRGRKGLSTVSLNSAIRGQPILATNFTAMRNAIADMHPVTPARSAGDEILATYFANSDTSLKSAINAVITTL